MASYAANAASLGVNGTETARRSFVPYIPKTGRLLTPHRFV